MPTPGWSLRILIAARRPSSVWPGGIRMSTIATSGWRAATSSLSASASPTAATISWPRSVRISASPALITAASSAMTMRILTGYLSGVGRQFDGNRRGAAARAVDFHAAVDGPDAFGQPVQAAARYGAGAAVTIVDHAEPEQAGDVHGFDGRVPGAAVLGDVGKQFGGAIVGDGLDRVRRPFGCVGDQLDRDRTAVRERGQRVGEAVVQGRGVDAPGQRSEVGDPLGYAAVGVVDKL